MEQEILTADQKRVLVTVGSESALSNFYLSGGTALAGYYLHHRLSDDLDFFSCTAPDSIFLHAFAEKLKNILAASAVLYEKLFDRHQFFFAIGGEELKVEFTHYPFKQIEQGILHDGIRIDSFRDISANKIMALLDRFDPKDFVDLFFILQQRLLEEIWHDAEKKFNIKIDPIFLSGEIAKVRRISALPRMVKSVSIDELKDFFGVQAKKLSPLILDA